MSFRSFRATQSLEPPAASPAPVRGRRWSVISWAVGNDEALAAVGNDEAPAAVASQPEAERGFFPLRTLRSMIDLTALMEPAQKEPSKGITILRRKSLQEIQAAGKKPRLLQLKQSREARDTSAVLAKAHEATLRRRSSLLQEGGLPNLYEALDLERPDQKVGRTTRHTAVLFRLRRLRNNGI